MILLDVIFGLVSKFNWVKVMFDICDIYCFFLIVVVKYLGRNVGRLFYIYGLIMIWVIIYIIVFKGF